MPWSTPHAPSKRVAAAALMRESDLSPAEIAARVQVPYPTLCKWNQRHGWRPSSRRRFGALRIARWAPERLAALARLADLPQVDPGDLAEALGLRRCLGADLLAACGLPARGSGRSDEDALRVQLRAHVARQIAELDAALSARRRARRPGEPGPVPDSGRILRDLGGLKRLIDGLAPPVAPAAPEDAGADLAALRAAIVQRYEAFVAQSPQEDPDAARERPGFTAR